MAQLTRVTGKVFGGSAPLNEIGQFGSAKTGTFNNTQDVATIQALQAYSNGWGSAIITSRNFPPIEEVTGVLKTISYQSCYLLQEGIPEYDINTEYSNTSIVKNINNGIITLYTSLTNNNVGNSLTDTTYWKPTELDLDGKANVNLNNVSHTSGFRKLIDIYVSSTGEDGYKVYEEYNPTTGDYVGKWCEQWGIVASQSWYQTGKEVTLLKNYSSLAYGCYGNYRYGGATNGSNALYICPLEVNKILVMPDASQQAITCYVNWLTYGYLAEE